VDKMGFGYLEEETKLPSPHLSSRLGLGTHMLLESVNKGMIEEGGYF
jgi:hypothetical protein